ncbi:APC family permease [Clostridium sp. Cult2]|uniref:APC family permease n=1 Tax=Clostridium sp. Cult2 TaxID=2079003 RepID=UPI001F3382E1|nr:APC family permease [Clostridium sp. Cult2]MCF6464740.1 amino acid ABC transporter permease [Clostridium sp. Cult2]
MKSKLNKIDVFSIVLGSIIGWGSFMLPGTKFLKEAGVINTTIGLTLGALFIITIQSSYYVMLENHNDEGGEFSFAYKHCGRNHGFVVGWFLLLAYLTIIPLNGTAFPLVIRKIFGDVLQFGYLYSIAGYEVYIGEVIISSLIVLLFAYVNIKGIKESAKVQNVIALTLVLLVFIVFIAMFLKVDRTSFYNNYIYNYKFDLGGMLKIFAITPFAFVGFDNVPQICKEFDFGAKKASLIAVASVAIGSLIYSILNMTTGLVYSPQEAVKLDWALGSGVLSILGRFGFLLLVIALSAAVTSGINGFMISTSKLMGSISNHHMVPKKYAYINENGVFKNAILFATGISLIAPWFGREVILWIVDMSSLGAAIAYFYVCFIAFRLGKTMFRKVMSILGVVASLLTVALLIVPSSPAALGRESRIALVLWIILGIVFYIKVVSSLKVQTSKDNV